VKETRFTLLTKQNARNVGLVLKFVRLRLGQCKKFLVNLFRRPFQKTSDG
jgi:hypothetical protein